MPGALGDTMRRPQAADPAQHVLDGAVLVVRSEAAHDRYGRPYLRLSLRNADGRLLEARWWRYPYPLERRPQVGQVCHVQGVTDHFGGAEQLHVQTMRPAPDVPIGDFIGVDGTPPEMLQAELDTRLDRLSQLDPSLAGLVQALLVGDGVIAARFRVWPAAHRHHGAVRHGLLAHSLRVATLAEQIASAYGQALTGALDFALVVAACLLHDVGKVYTLPEIPGTALPESASDADHVTRSVLLVHAAAVRLAVPLPAERLECLTHAILAHHARREWGAPVEPHTAEALLVHLADYAESRVWHFANEGQAKTLEQSAGGQVPHMTL